MPGSEGLSEETSAAAACETEGEKVAVGEAAPVETEEQEDNSEKEVLKNSSQDVLEEKSPLEEVVLESQSEQPAESIVEEAEDAKLIKKAENE